MSRYNGRYNSSGQQNIFSNELRNQAAGGIPSRTEFTDTHTNLNTKPSGGGDTRADTRTHSGQHNLRVELVATDFGPGFNCEHSRKKGERVLLYVRAYRDRPVPWR